MKSLTPKQKGFLTIFDQYDNCRVIRFADHLTQSVRYAVQYWDSGSECNYSYPNTRTINSLIGKDILTETDNDIFELQEIA